MSPGEPVSPQERGSPVSAAAQLLNAVAIAVTTLRLYRNVSQPGFDRAVELMRTAASQQLVNVRVMRERFEADGQPVPMPTESLKALATDLYDRGVTEIRVRSVPEPEELAGLAALVAADIDEVESSGGPKAFLESRGVLAFMVTARSLEVSEARAATPEAIALSKRVRELLGDRKILAGEIESNSTPLEAYGTLRSILDEGLQFAVGRSDLDGGLADTIAAMSASFRANLVSIAIQRLSQDEMATTIVGQLSDSELAESLTLIAGQLGVEEVMADAVKVVESVRGGNPELPVIVARRLIDGGADREAVMNALAAAFGTAAVAVPGIADPGNGVVLTSAEDEFDVAELRGEAAEPGPEADLQIGTATLLALFRSAGREREFEELVDFAEQSVVQWIREGAPEKSLALLEVLVGEAENHPDPARRARLDQAARAAVSAEMVSDLLSMSAGRSNLVAGRLLEILRERSIPALLAQLAEESDRTRRKMLVEMLVEVGRNDVSLLLPLLADKRWYFVRNLASILGRIHLPEVVPHLIRLCSHADPRVRREALRSAAAFGGASAAALSRAATDPDESVRMAAIAGLGAVTSSEASAVLMKIAGDRSKSLKDRKEAIISLSLHPGESPLGFLKKTAGKKWPPTSVTRQLAQHAAQALKRPPRRPDTS